MDAYEAAGEEAGRKLHKNVESSIKQVPGDNTPRDSNYTDTCPPSTKTIQVRRTRHAGHCWRSKDELISDVLLWTPHTWMCKSGTTSTNLHTAAMWETRDVTLKTCQRRWMIGRNGERRSGISAQAARHDDDDVRGVLLFCRDAVSAFYSSSRLYMYMWRKNETVNHIRECSKLTQKENKGPYRQFRRIRVDQFS